MEHPNRTIERLVVTCVVLGVTAIACDQPSDEESVVDADTSDGDALVLSGEMPLPLVDPFSPVATPTLPASTGATYYASPSGGGTGTSATSPLTLAGAMNKAGPGATILLLPGSYGAYTWPAGKNGTAAAPITLRAQTRAITIANHAPQKAASSSRAKLGKLSLTGTQYVRIDGVDTQAVWLSSASWIEIRNNYVFGDASRGVSVAGSSHVMIHDNLIENFAKSPTNSLAWFTDYGIFFYPGTDFDVYNNVWNGGFNHAISTKTSTTDLLITGNYFYNCGRHCIELGQQTDGNSNDRTSQNIQIRRNLFSMTNASYVNAAYQITVYNADDVTIDDNEFRNFNTSSILISMLDSVYCSSKGERLSNVGIKPNNTKLSKLRFVGGHPLIRITTRGIVGDKVELSEITGGTCTVATGVPSGVPGPCGWAPGFPETTKPPAISYLDSSISCH